MRWKRAIERVVLCLLLGALITVLVSALGSLDVALFSRLRGKLLRPDGWTCYLEKWTVTGTDYPAYTSARATPANRGMNLTYYPPYGDRAMPWWSTLNPPSEETIPEGMYLQRFRESVAGWPFPAFRCVVAEGTDRDRIVMRARVHGHHLAIKRDTGFYVYIPVSPFWPGFAGDTVFYGAATGVFMLVRTQVVRFRRRRRGLCPFCRYDLSGSDSDTCPECGRTIRR